MYVMHGCDARRRPRVGPSLTAQTGCPPRGPAVRRGVRACGPHDGRPAWMTASAGSAGCAAWAKEKLPKEARAANKAHPMSKIQERGGRVPGFSTGVQKDILEILSNAASPNGRSSALHTLVSKLVIPCALPSMCLLLDVSLRSVLRRDCRSAEAGRFPAYRPVQ